MVIVKSLQLVKKKKKSPNQKYPIEDLNGQFKIALIFESKIFCLPYSLIQNILGKTNKQQNE